MTAAFASREPIEAASSAAVVPAGTDRSEPSGNLIVISSAMGRRVSERPSGSRTRWLVPGSEHLGAAAPCRPALAVGGRRALAVGAGPDGRVAGGGRRWVALGLLGGVLVDVLLAGELADLV